MRQRGAVACIDQTRQTRDQIVYALFWGGSAQNNIYLNSNAYTHLKWIKNRADVTQLCIYTHIRRKIWWNQEKLKQKWEKKSNSIIYPSKTEMGVSPQVFPVIDHHHARITRARTQRNRRKYYYYYLLRCFAWWLAATTTRKRIRTRGHNKIARLGRFFDLFIALYLDIKCVRLASLWLYLGWIYLAYAYIRLVCAVICKNLRERISSIFL